MDSSRLDEIIATVQSESPLFEGSDIQRDHPLSESQLADFEAQYKIVLPVQYKRFLNKYGAGVFLYSHVYSCDPDSSWSLWRESEYVRGIGESILPFSDYGCGDYLLFRIIDGNCSDRVFWADHECGYSISDSEYESFNEYIVKVALMA